MDNISLSNFYQVKRRFHRSVHLERDFYTNNTLDGYILTITAREMLSRIIATLENDTTSKAWSLTGPYGSGKSAFALFTAKLLGDSHASTTQALELLKKGDVSLYERFANTKSTEQITLAFCPVLISGERAPLPHALLRGLEQGLKNFGIVFSSSLRRKIRKLIKITENGISPQASEVTGLFESATCAIKKHGGQGLLLVIDELGKFLEYAAENPAQGDLFVLQTLAEFATRSEQTPLLLLTILHQAFEQYASKLAESQQEEWAKVQGRFEDVAFVEPTEQILRLIGSAIEKKAGANKEENLSALVKLNLKPSQLNEADFTQLIKNCFPLHPIVALVIDPIFRRFAQNERSLFAFLSSNEHYGLQDFLSKECYSKNGLPMFSIANLYDYLHTNMEHRLYTSRYGKRWAEIESALDRLLDASALSIKLVKTIGILGIVGEAIPNLKASKELLHYVLDDNTPGVATEFEQALETLRERSIVIYRLYNQAYALWEGSDIDLEAKLREAKGHVDTRGAIATDLSRYLPTRPLVARRHLFETGTLRYFTVRYTDVENFESDLAAPLKDADGLLLYALPVNKHEFDQLTKKVSSSDLAHRQEVLIAIPYTIGTLQEAVTQLASLRWVAENTPELEGDAVARDELSVQYVQAERDISDRLTSIFAGNTEDACKWYHKGQSIDIIHSQRLRNAYLSKICDEVYHKTPIIRNELINKQKISGVITTARRKLIQAMLENGDQESLGITGAPPEMSIYRSLLWNTENTGIHREVSGAWGFHPPNSDDENRIADTWKAIEDFLAECEGKRQPVEHLYEKLMKPPLGVRREPLPILLCAVMLHYKREVALYENGSFIPDWSIPVFERMLKAPQRFELKRFRIAGIRTDLFEKFLRVFNRPMAAEKPDLLTVVTPLIHAIARLPKYTLATQELTDAAANLRKTVLNAREPDEFLFYQLPKALGFPAFDTETGTDVKVVSDFFTTLQEVLSELEQAYEVLLNSIEQMLVKAFNLTPDREKLRLEFARRAEPLLAVTVDMQLKGFIMHVARGNDDFTKWIEAIANYLTQKSPASWVDLDKAQFETNLSQLVRKFQHFEIVSYDKLEHTQSLVGEKIDKLERTIEQCLDENDSERNPEVRLAVLARVSRKLMALKDKQDAS